MVPGREGGKQQVLQIGQVPLLTTPRPVVHSKVLQLQAVPLQVVLVQVAQLQVAVWQAAQPQPQARVMGMTSYWEESGQIVLMHVLLIEKFR